MLLIFSFLLLTFLPLLIFVPTKQKVVTQTPKSRFTFMTGVPAAVSDKHDLLYWEKVGTPFLFAKPDYKFGYSAFLRPEVNYGRPGSSEVRALPVLKTDAGIVLPEVPRPRLPEGLLNRAEIPLVQIGNAPAVRKIQAPLFLLEDGSRIPVEGLPKLDNLAGSQNPTVIRISRAGAGVPPVIRVIESCGDPQLDRIAVRALYLPAVSNEKVTGVVRVEWNSREENR